MASVIKETQSIKEAVTLINSIDVNKFSRLISRIIQKLHLKGERTFSEEEEQKLQMAFSVDKQALDLILETSAFILEQAVYHNVKPSSLQQQLQGINMNLDKAEVFSQTWSTSGPQLVDRLKHNIFAPKKFRVYPASCPMTAGIGSSTPTTLVRRSGSENGWMDELNIEFY
ncbi:COMM domain-containing protein 10 isoform X2 [Phycodurus eques]|uniref:COMM domain-containing protein 10 isoform X2 n=1 Tax=Phycodurus eques TaxID=693459 RepID=UPI002ACDFD8F|nr:COMM domain-containing protein 10 isoform X2 [Phycodurus eques]